MKIDKQILEKLYIQEKKSCREIAQLFETSMTQVSRLLKKFAIPARPFTTKGLDCWWIKGKPKSEETKLKLSLANKGKKLTAERKERLYKVSKPYHYKSGTQHPNWKGGRTLTTEGYIKIKMRNHPFCDSQGYVLEHRLVMEDKLNRLLNIDEIVHHINGIRTDNRIENLELTTQEKHGHIHWDDDKIKKEQATFMSNLRKKRFWSTKKI